MDVHNISLYYKKSIIDINLQAVNRTIVPPKVLCVSGYDYLTLGDH
jgi:hypothetical protein